jgi:phenylalanyl-tRNA synthetase beta chain
VIIGASKVRGVESQGMLCSARELGLGEAAEGIRGLPPDAPVGTLGYLRSHEAGPKSHYPNRGDVMSVLGLAGSWRRPAV